MVTILLVLAFVIGRLFFCFYPVYIDNKASQIEEKEIDKTTYIKSVLKLYYADGTQERYFYHKGCWYLKSENVKRDKYVPCEYDTARWLSNKLASIEITEKYTDYKQNGL